MLSEYQLWMRLYRKFLKISKELEGRKLKRLGICRTLCEYSRHEVSDSVVDSAWNRLHLYGQPDETLFGYYWTLDSIGHRQRANFCRRMARLCKKELSL